MKKNSCNKKSALSCKQEQLSFLKPTPLEVSSIIQENYRTKSLCFSASVFANPGQFVMVWHPDQAEKPFSITSANPLTITVSDVGPFSHFLNSKLKVGDKLWFRGPFGEGVFNTVEGKKIIIYGGCGCVPVFHLAQAIQSNRMLEQTIVFAGARNKQELLFKKKFQDLGFEVKVATDDGSVGSKGLVTDLLEKELQKEKVSCVYSCGPAPMLKKVAQICEEHKVNYQVSLEEIMKCGIGVCGSCAKEGRLVCKDGPVFTKWSIGKNAS